MHFPSVFLPQCLVLISLQNVARGQGPARMAHRPVCNGAGNNAFEKNCIVPDLIDLAPPEYLLIQFTSLGLKVEDGNELTPEEVSDAPDVVLWPADPAALYTLSKIDPDATSRQNYSVGPINHWLVVNIPRTDISKGDVLMPYLGAGPPAGTGLHRYVFLVYKQTGPLNVIAVGKEYPIGPHADRTNFEIRQFAKRYNLGNPVAGNFYQAQHTVLAATVSTSGGDSAWLPFTLTFNIHFFLLHFYFYVCGL